MRVEWPDRRRDVLNALDILSKAGASTDEADMWPTTTDLTRDWPADPSLRISVRTEGGPHSFYCFNECGVERDGESEAFCIEGTITFDDLVVFDAEARDIPIETFIADGVRQWDALYADDERLSVDAQRESQNRAPKWRKWAEGAKSAMGPM